MRLLTRLQFGNFPKHLYLYLNLYLNWYPFRNPLISKRFPGEKQVGSPSKKLYGSLNIQLRKRNKQEALGDHFRDRAMRTMLDNNVIHPPNYIVTRPLHSLFDFINQHYANSLHSYMHFTTTPNHLCNTGI